MRIQHAGFTTEVTESTEDGKGSIPLVEFYTRWRLQRSRRWRKNFFRSSASLTGVRHQRKHEILTSLRGLRVLSGEMSFLPCGFDRHWRRQRCAAHPQQAAADHEAQRYRLGS